jgi:hypothetical protein
MERIKGARPANVCCVWLSVAPTLTHSHCPGSPQHTLACPTPARRLQSLSASRCVSQHTFMLRARAHSLTLSLLQTYVDWHHPDLSPLELAEAGFVHTPTKEFPFRCVLLSDHRVCFVRGDGLNGLSHAEFVTLAPSPTTRSLPFPITSALILLSLGNTQCQDFIVLTSMMVDFRYMRRVLDRGYAPIRARSDVPISVCVSSKCCIPHPV